MHELSITQNIVDIAQQHAGRHQVRRVRLEIGQLSAIVPEAVRFCFGPCTTGTLLAEAALEITEVPGRGRCRQCGSELPLEMPFGVCDCGSTDLEIIQGQELKIIELEIDEALCA